MRLVIVPFSLILFSFFFFHKTVYIQPLGNVQGRHIKDVEQVIRSFYGFECVVLPAAAHNELLCAKSHKRYDATKILNWFLSVRHHILVITEKDIAHYKSSAHPEWGILGLGKKPGKICVVSTYRMGKEEEVSERLKKVTVHELGHNFSLDHCTNDTTCIMRAADGKIQQIDQVKLQFCKSCKRKLIF
jgi:archaemetzincin